jgi:hypothetical protein
MWLKPERKTIINVILNVEKSGLSYIAGTNIKCAIFLFYKKDSFSKYQT